MAVTKAPRTRAAVLAVLLGGVLCLAGYPGRSVADDTAENQALKEQMRILMQRLDALTKEVEALRHQQQGSVAPGAASAAAPPNATTTPSAAAAAPPGAPGTSAAGGTTTPDASVPATGPSPALAGAAPAEPKLEKFLKGFYGTLDVSFDDTTKGIKGLVAYPYALVDPNNPNSGYVVAGGPKSGPVGRVGYMPALSTNKSQIGYRAEHKIGSSGTDFIVQVETALALTSSPGLRTYYTQQSNVVTGAIGLGDTYVGLQGSWGKLKFGTTYSPYKKSTDRLNPFSGMLGDYAVIMGNSGGDNRVEFGTRLDHSLWYESPKLLGKLVSFDLLYSPGQNRTFDNVVQSAGSPDCNGGNMPGSGNLPLNCDDGGFDDAYSVDLKFEAGGFYATAAYELHRRVNRNSDGIGSNNPVYGYLLSTNSPLLDFDTFNGYVAEFPGYAAIASPAYLTDIGDESAFKVGAQYVFQTGLTVSAIWEDLRRNLPAVLRFQNERQRSGTWVALSQDFFGARDNISIGWGHAGKTPGDPGGQHNYNPLAPANTADMYTIAWKHRFDKQLTWYLDSALTINHGNAHYDLGAGGRGLTTDCHDGTNTVFVDYSGAGPTTWGGCRIEGFSTGLNYKF